MPYGIASSPEGGALRVATNFLEVRKSSPFGRAGEECSDETERVGSLPEGAGCERSEQTEGVFLLQSVQIYAILPSAVFLRGILKEQLRILGSPVQLELCRAKPTGAGGSCAVKIIPLEYYHESESFRP